MKFILALVIAAASVIGYSEAKSFKDAFPEIYPQIKDEYKAGIDRMDIQEGVVKIKGGLAQIDLPEGYYFLGPDDSRFVLEKVWKNPDASDALGMIFPKAISPFDGGSWSILVTYDDIGNVSDDDAGKYDYADLLKQMQSDVKENNAWRKEKGYDEVELVGWAAEPHYDKSTRKLFWAKDLRFSGSDTDTLNYNIRVLGRKGVLVLNFIADMQELPLVEKAVPDVLKMVNFTEGNRYADFVPGLDKVAAVGIGGLIAGQVLAKTGVLFAALLFFKKFALLILLPVVAFFRRIFKRGGTS